MYRATIIAGDENADCQEIESVRCAPSCHSKREKANVYTRFPQGVAAYAQLLPGQSGLGVTSRSSGVGDQGSVMHPDTFPPPKRGQIATFEY